MIRNILLTIITLAILSAFIVASYYLLGKRMGPQEDHSFVAPIPGRQRDDESPKDDSLKSSVLARVAPELLSLFNEPNDWRRTTGNIIASTDRDAFFIFKGRPSFSTDGRTITLDACTVVFMPNPNGGDYQSEEERAKSAIVFESTDRVDLVFSKSLLEFMRTEKFDISLSSFVSGEMHGPVVIRSEIEPQSQDDDFFLQTRNVVFTTKQIRSNYEVSFSFGKNHGAGRGLTVDLEIPTSFKRDDKKARVDAGEENADQNARQGDEPEPTIAEQVDQMVDEGNLGGGFSLRKIEIDEVTEYARFYLDANAMKNAGGAGLKKDENGEDAPGYLEVHCKKDVTFAPNTNEMGGWCASFTKDVDLLYYQADEKQVNLKCDRLYLYLQDPEIDQFTAGNPEALREVKRKKLNGKIQNLSLTVVRAISEEARASIDVFGQKLKIQAGEFQYNLKTGLIDLTAHNSPDPVSVLKYDGDAETTKPVVEFASGNIQAALNEKYEILRVVANSNGQAVLRLKSSAGQTHLVHASWQDGLKASPETRRKDIVHVVASGAINFYIPELGSFNANEINFWCRFNEDVDAAPSDDADALLRQVSYARAPQTRRYADQAPQYRRSANEGFPIKLYKSVDPIAARMSGAVSFRSPTMTADMRNAVTVRFASEPIARVTRDDAASTRARERSATANASREPTSQDKRYQLSGGLLTLWCVFVDDLNAGAHKRSFDMYRMQLVEAAEFSETNATTGAVITKLSADFAQIDNPESANARIEIRGKERDAQFQTSNLTLVGRNVVVDRAANTFTVAGGGSIAFQPPEQRKSTNASSNLERFFTNDPIQIAWDESMTFNGSQLIFMSQAPNKVSITQFQRRAQAEIIQSLICSEARVTLKRPLSIFDVNAKDKSQLEVKLIECLGNQGESVDARITGVDEQEIAELYQGRFASVAFDLETQTARVAKGGEIFAATKSQGATNLLPNALQQNNGATEQNAKGWIRTHATFAGALDADLAKRTIVANDRVRIAVAECQNANTRLNVNDLKLPEGTSQISADKATLQLVEQASASNDARLPASFEIIAQGNVTLKRDEYSGVCDSLRYSAAKDLIVLTASDSSQGRLIRQKGSAATREDLANFKRCDIKLNPFSYSLEGLSKFD